jgi:putative phage-type endonuclease
VRQVPRRVLAEGRTQAGAAREAGSDMTTLASTAYDVVCSAGNRPAWLKARLSGCGASDSPVLLGASGFSSPIELWGQKTGRILAEPAETDRMLWGQRLEPLVAEEYERKTQRVLIRSGMLLRSTRWPFMLATPDYFWENAPVEIKTTDFSHRSDWQDGPPERVNIQLQHQMAVTGAEKGSTGVLVGGNTFYWADVPRDDALIARIVSVCENFWEQVKSETLPLVDGTEKTTDALKKLYPLSSGETIMLPQEAIQWSNELAAAEEEEADIKTHVRTLENKIKAALGNAEVGEMPDGSAPWTYKTFPRRAYQVAATSYRKLNRRSE